MKNICFKFLSVIFIPILFFGSSAFAECYSNEYQAIKKTIKFSDFIKKVKLADSHSVSMSLTDEDDGVIIDISDFSVKKFDQWNITADRYVIRGLKGNDVICVIGKIKDPKLNFVIKGDDGNDFLEIEKDVKNDHKIELRGDAGADELYGSNSGDILKGYDGNDTITGNKGDDDIYGGSGNDLISQGKSISDLSNTFLGWSIRDQWVKYHIISNWQPMILASPSMLILGGDIPTVTTTGMAPIYDVKEKGVQLFQYECTNSDGEKVGCPYYQSGSDNGGAGLIQGDDGDDVIVGAGAPGDNNILSGGKGRDLIFAMNGYDYIYGDSNNEVDKEKDTLVWGDKEMQGGGDKDICYYHGSSPGYYENGEKCKD